MNRSWRKHRLGIYIIFMSLIGVFGTDRKEDDFEFDAMETFAYPTSQMQDARGCLSRSLYFFQQHDISAGLDALQHAVAIIPDCQNRQIEDCQYVDAMVSEIEQLSSYQSDKSLHDGCAHLRVWLAC